MPNVIGSKSDLDSICIDGAFWNKHYASTVYEKVDGGHIGPAEEFSSCSAYRLLTRKIDLQSTIIDVRVFRFEGIDAFLKLGYSPTRDDEVCGRLRRLHTSLVLIWDRRQNLDHLQRLLQLRNQSLHD